MVRPAARRALVHWAREAYQVSQRRACRSVGVYRALIRYRSCRPSQAPLRARLRELAAVRLRAGYQQLYVLLRREGWRGNHERIYRLYTEEATSRGAASTLPRGSRAALAEAAQLTDGVWVVDCPEEVSRETEHWFQQAAALESATPGGDEGRFVTLADAVRAIRDGRMKSGRERGAR